MNDDRAAILEALRELQLALKGRSRKLTANRGMKSQAKERKMYLDSESENALNESESLITKLLNLKVSQTVIIRAALQAFYIKLLNLMEYGQTALTESEKQMQLSRLFLLRALLYKAAQQKVGR